MEMPFPTPPYFPYLYPRKKGRKMDYRNLAEEELKLRIAEQFFPTYDCAHRIGKIDFTGAKGARPVRATSGQGEDHTGGTSCRVAGVACSAPTEDRTPQRGSRQPNGWDP